MFYIFGIPQSATPTDCLRVIYKESVELNFVYLNEGCGKTLLEINDTIPHTRIDMGYWDQNAPNHMYLYESECCSVSSF